MEDEKLNLNWGKFAGQLSLCLIALIGGIHASLHFFVAEAERIRLANTEFGPIIGAFLVFGTFLLALRIMRVPYKTDMFERRLRNWSMTYAAVFVFTMSISLNIGFQYNNDNGYIITPYIMPALWLVCYLIHSQYTRYCIATGRRNSFLDGNRC